MKIKLLPNWCKKIGFGVFIICAILSGYIAFAEGFQIGMNGEPINPKKNINLFTDNWLHIFDVLAILGMIIYMFSKEEVEDDYINKLRLESFQLTALVGLAITITAYAVSEEIKLTLDYFITLFLWFYLATFALKKRSY